MALANDCRVTTLRVPLLGVSHVSPKETAYLQNVASLGWLQKRELQCNIHSGLRPNTSESLCPQGHKRLWKNSQRVRTPEDGWWKIKSGGACRPLTGQRKSLSKGWVNKDDQKGGRREWEKRKVQVALKQLLTVSEETSSQNRCPCAQHSVSSVKANYGRPGFMSAQQMVNIPPGIV